MVWNAVDEHLTGLVSALDTLLAELGTPDR
jgi:hypothetical protein